MNKLLLGLATIIGLGLIMIGGFSLRNWLRAGITPGVDLGRPLIVGIISWPGYAGGITANRGFQENSESIFTKKYGLPVRFVLIEDIDARGKAFARGGPSGVDVVWSTIDFWANELPNLRAGGINGKAFLQLDWSQGGDAIVANESVRTVEDLRGKKIALVQFTPSHWLLETVLRRSTLSAAEQQAIRDNLVFAQDVSTARSAFVAEQVDAAVVWEPDVKQALKRQGAHVLTSSRDLPNLIADVMVAEQDFIEQHPRTIEAFIRGWLDGVEEAKQNPDLAARLLMENEPLFQDLGFEATRDSLSWAYWPNLEDNAEMFGLNGSNATFDKIFSEASTVWQELGVIDKPVAAQDAKDDSVLRRVNLNSQL